MPVFKTLKRLALLVLALVVLTAISYEVRADLSVTVGHRSHHWVSDAPNEEHAMVMVQIDSVVFGRANNSYKQPGFSGETYFLGLAAERRLTDNLNSYMGHLMGKAAVGVNYGYTAFYGHEPGASKRVLPFIAIGAFYRQPVGIEWYVEVGVLQFGDATIPSAAAGRKF